MSKFALGGGLRGNSLIHKYKDIIAVDNLLLAWREFARGKRNRPDVQEFSLHLADNILTLHTELTQQSYRHHTYHAFRISDPKPRQIHKATVRDRIVHRAIYRILYPYFHTRFIYDSYSCRLGKGTHRALRRFYRFGWKLSQNNIKPVWILKCDIRKFFASIDQVILIELLRKHIPDQNIIWLLERIICSFHSSLVGKGLPLGNLTSQLFANIYLNELDQFIKHGLKQKYYIRYADDFVILNPGKNLLQEFLPKIADFLNEKLKLTLHPNKIFLKTLASGADFLGWVHFPKHRVLRTATKRRMLKKVSPANLDSYLGLLRWGNGYGLQRGMLDCSYDPPRHPRPFEFS